MQLDAERRDFAASLRDTLRVLRSQWWLVALCTLVTAAAGYVWASTRPTEHQSRSRVLVVQTNPAASFGAGQPFVDPARERATDLQLVESPAVAQRVVRRLKLKTSPGELLSHVNATSNGDSNVIDIVVKSRDASFTAPVANAFAREFVSYRRANDTQRYATALRGMRARIGALGKTKADRAERKQLRAQIRQLAVLSRLQTGGSQVIERAAGAGGEVGKDTARTTIIAALIGLLLGLALAFIRDRLDPRLRNEDAVRAMAPGVPIVGTIPTANRRGRWIAGEGFHNLQVNVDALSPDGHARSLLVTGTMPGEGKSTTAANLAAAMSGKGRNVTVFEADLRRPGLSNYLGVNGQPGVSSVLAGKASAAEIGGRATVEPRRRGRGPDMFLKGEFGFVPAGPRPDDPRSVIDETALAELVDSSGQTADTVIVDGPPIGMFSDMMPLAQRVEGVLVAVRLGHTRRAALERVLERLANASVRPMGIVVLGADDGSAEYGHYSRG